MRDLISVIVPVYNVEAFLGECLESLIKQTYSNIEIILIDDGATDNSGEICDMYAERHENIKVIHTKNQGVSAARNEGMRHAKGQYIGFVDSDDWVEPDMFEILHDVLIKENADYSVCRMINEFQQTSEFKRNNVENYQLVDRENAFKLMIEDKGFYGYVCNKLFVRDKMHKLEFNENLTICEDIEFVAKYTRTTERVAYITEQLYHYRHIEQSATGNFKYNKKHLSILDAYEKIIPIYLENCKSYVLKLYRNYLKIAINIKGRMGLTGVKDANVTIRLETIIRQYYPLVMKNKDVRILTKINIFLSVHFSSQLLWGKQKILQRKIRSN